MKAFDTLPDEAQLDVRKEARYLAYVDRFYAHTAAWYQSQGGYQLGSRDSSRPPLSVSLLAIQLLHSRPGSLHRGQWTVILFCLPNTRRP